MKEELYHHGIKGMKWGVRRFQNYDGTYTQRGYQRYKKSEARYDAANERVNKAKANKDDAELSKAKLERAAAKRQMNKNYKQLKKDKRADKGKDLAAEGKTVYGQLSTKHLTQYALASLGTMAYSTAKHIYRKGGDAKTINAISAIAGLSYAGLIATTVKYNNNIRNIRAYRNH